MPFYKVCFCCKILLKATFQCFLPPPEFRMHSSQRHRSCGSCRRHSVLCVWRPHLDNAVSIRPLCEGPVRHSTGLSYPRPLAASCPYILVPVSSPPLPPSPRPYPGPHPPFSAVHGELSRQRTNFVGNMRFGCNLSKKKHEDAACSRRRRGDASATSS